MRYKSCSTIAQPTITSPLNGAHYNICLLTRCVTWDAPDADLVEVDSVSEAEDYVFTQASQAREPWDGLAFALRRQAAYLAHRNRRGYANLLFMSLSMWEKLPQEQLFIDWEKFGNSVGRWVHRGVLRKFDNTGSAIFTSDCIEDDVAYVAFKGVSDVDSVAHLFCQNQQMRLWCPQGVDFASGCEQYITQVKFD